jgi:hypothetical protein
MPAPTNRYPPPAGTPYPFVGDNYKAHGEVPGYIYYPYTDQYYINPKAVRDQYEQQGVIDKPVTPPSAEEQLGTMALGAGTAALAVEAGKGIGSGSWFGGAAPVANAGVKTGSAAATGTTQGVATPNVLGASRVADAPAAQGGLMGNLGLGGVGQAAAANPVGIAGGAAALGMYLNNMYEGGGKDILKGKGKGEDYTNLFLDINPVTAPINMGLRALGMKSVGRTIFGGPSTGELQSQRLGGLLKAGKVSQAEYDAMQAGRTAAYTGYGNKGGRTDTHVAADFVGQGKDDKGNSYNVNNKFAQSRDEKDLTTDDTIGAAAHYEALGSQKYTGEWSDADRRKYNQRLLDAKLINESGGDLFYADAKRAKEIADQIDKEREAAKTQNAKSGGLIGAGQR